MQNDANVINEVLMLNAQRGHINIEKNYMTLIIVQQNPDDYSKCVYNKQ